MENVDEIEVCQNVEPHEMEETVKSKAVVKYSQTPMMVDFNRLECNTNLNLPPSNWLTNADSNYGLHQALYNSPGFASFRMAHMFPGCVSEVDVVADAENIKRLLKLPYISKGAISMIVHKVGNTLLLDEFDIQKYLLRKADDDWQWLRTFILEQILSYKGGISNFCLKDKSRKAIQTKNLLSKFLYYSMKQTSNGVSFQLMEDTKSSKSTDEEWPVITPVLPEPKIEENVPDPASSREFQRNVVWTFEDIRMLIGTDMPIFGGPNRPCISLRLRDMSKPINVLTGIDYWLDNLMCNVPEVVMCYHLDGIVQKYEIIKTEDLPYLENSKFSPRLVRNVAQNILSFLKVNATKEGHTYWLFKAHNDDVVKLYDLTTLCKDESNDSECPEAKGNPFTIPVGMLLYTVARNMKNRSTNVSSKTAGNIRALLNNCIKLLPKEKFPQIVTSSHYILADLYIPVGIDPKNPSFDEYENDSDLQSIYDEDEDKEFEENGNIFYADSDMYSDVGSSYIDLNINEKVAVKNICDTLKDFHSEDKFNSKHRPPPLVANTEERCLMALEHVNKGLSCLQFFNSNDEKFIKDSEMRFKDEEKQRILHEEQNPTMAKSLKSIPLPYKTSEKQELLTISDDAINTMKSLPENQSKPKKAIQVPNTEIRDPKQVADNFNSQRFGSWNIHLKVLLLEKAHLTYKILAEKYYIAEKYGSALRCLYMACRCQKVTLKYTSAIVSKHASLLGRAGDFFLQLSKNYNHIDQYLLQYHNLLDNEINIANELEKELANDDNTELIAPQKDLEYLMVSSCSCYESALQHNSDNAGGDRNTSETTNELLRSLGFVNNELGVKYMHWATDSYNAFAEDNKNDVEGIILQNASSIANTVPLLNHRNPRDLTLKSFDCLRRSIQCFEYLNDNVNLLFLYLNMGKLMRLRALLPLGNESLKLAQQQKTFYKEAVNYYDKARDVLCYRKAISSSRDSYLWEISSAVFQVATDLQDNSSQELARACDLEREVLELLHKALDMCNVEHLDYRKVAYNYRSGLIHKRIASFHYSQLRNKTMRQSHLPKVTLQLCKYHYEKAANILESLKELKDFLVVQLERISLQEFLTENSAKASQKIKHLECALELCFQAKVIFQSGLNNNSVDSNFIKYANLFESRLQSTLRTLIKLLITSKDPMQKCNIYKKMYMKCLNIKKRCGDSSESDTIGTVARKLIILIDSIMQSYNKDK